MKIHSLHGCACWNWGNAYPPNIRDEYRLEIKRVGHVAGCAGHPSSALTYPLRRPSAGLCRMCNGQGKCIDHGPFVGHLRCAECASCKGQRSSPYWQGDTIRQWSLQERLQGRKVSYEWRKWDHSREDSYHEAIIKRRRRQGHTRWARRLAQDWFGRGRGPV